MYSIIIIFYSTVLYCRYLIYRVAYCVFTGDAGGKGKVEAVPVKRQLAKAKSAATSAGHKTPLTRTRSLVPTTFHTLTDVSSSQSKTRANERPKAQLLTSDTQGGLTVTLTQPTPTDEEKAKSYNELLTGLRKKIEQSEAVDRDKKQSLSRTSGVSSTENVAMQQMYMGSNKPSLQPPNHWLMMTHGPLRPTHSDPHDMMHYEGQFAGGHVALAKTLSDEGKHINLEGIKHAPLSHPDLRHVTSLPASSHVPQASAVPPAVPPGGANGHRKLGRQLSLKGPEDPRLQQKQGGSIAHNQPTIKFHGPPAGHPTLQHNPYSHQQQQQQHQQQHKPLQKHQSLQLKQNQHKPLQKHPSFQQQQESLQKTIQKHQQALQQLQQQQEQHQQQQQQQPQSTWSFGTQEERFIPRTQEERFIPRTQEERFVPRTQEERFTPRSVMQMANEHHVLPNGQVSHGLLGATHFLSPYQNEHQSVSRMASAPSPSNHHDQDKEVLHIPTMTRQNSTSDPQLHIYQDDIYDQMGERGPPFSPVYSNTAPGSPWGWGTFDLTGSPKVKTFQEMTENAQNHFGVTFGHSKEPQPQPSNSGNQMFFGNQMNIPCDEEESILENSLQRTMTPPQTSSSGSSMHYSISDYTLPSGQQENKYPPSTLVHSQSHKQLGPIGSPIQPAAARSHSSSMAPPNNDNIQGTDPRFSLYYHLCGLFPETKVRQVMCNNPEETNPQVLCALIIGLGLNESGTK